jgi:ankyrin repeat protein
MCAPIRCSGNSPLLHALQQRCESIAELLIENGARADMRACAAWQRRGYDALHYCVRNGYVGVLLTLLTRHPWLLQRPSPVHALHVAVASTETECLDLLLNLICAATPQGSAESHVEGTGIASIDKSTITSTASGPLFGLPKDRSSNAMLEVQIGAEPLEWEWSLNSNCSTKSISSGTPLHVACHLGKCAAAEMLLTYGVIVDSRDSSLQTPLHIAVQHGYSELVALLVKHGANVNARDPQLRTPVMLAAKEDNLEVIHLLSKSGADFFLRDICNRQALHFAAAEGHMEVVYYLVHAGGDLTACDGLGISAIDYAITAPSKPLKLSPPDDPFVNLDRCSLEAMRRLCQSDPVVVEKAMRHFSQPALTQVISYRHGYVCPPLHRSICLGIYDSMTILLDAGADINASGSFLGRPLMLACSLGRLPAVKALIRRGAQTSYTEDGVLINVVNTAKYHFDILQWLMVGRFTDHPKMIQHKAFNS